MLYSALLTTLFLARRTSCADHTELAASYAAARCPAGCTTHGNCNAELGICDCPLGRRGAACELETLTACHIAPELDTLCSSALPTSCACAVACDSALHNRTGTRPLDGMQCLLGAPDAGAHTSALDAYLLSEQGWPTAQTDLRPWPVAPLAQCPSSCSGRGACLVEHGKAHCRCAPGFEGEDCERIAPAAPCLNDCSLRGVCQQPMAWCACAPGFWGMDCALSMEPGDAVPRLWGRLRPPRRPSVYIYHLPAGLNAYAWHRYVDRPAAEHLLERLASSDHRTTDGSRADLFYVPLFLRKQGDNCAANAHAGIAWIAKHYPFYAASAATPNHMLVAPADFGPADCVGDPMPPHLERRLIWLTHHGGWAARPHFQRGIDVLLPPLQHIEPAESPLLPLTQQLPRLHEAPERNITLFWAGSVSQSSAAHNMRRAVMALAAEPGFVLRDTTTQGPEPHYASRFAAARFCLAPDGTGGWGRRATLAALYGCVPVMVQDAEADALDELLDWTAFSLRVPEADITRLPAILAAVPAEQLAAMQRELACAAPRWQFSSVTGAVAGEDGGDDAISSVLELLWQRQRGGGKPRTPCELQQARASCRGDALPYAGQTPELWRVSPYGPALDRAAPNHWPAGGAACGGRTERPCSLPLDKRGALPATCRAHTAQ